MLWYFHSSACPEPATTSSAFQHPTWFSMAGMPVLITHIVNFNTIVTAWVTSSLCCCPVCICHSSALRPCIITYCTQCHACGVVVRDVKPENFLFLDKSPHSPLKMIDFGIAEYCAPQQQLEDRAGGTRANRGSACSRCQAAVSCVCAQLNQERVKLNHDPN